MKKLIILFAFLPNLVFAQLFTEEFSFELVQRIDTSSISFTYRPQIKLDELQKGINNGDEIFPGGKTFFIIRLSSPLRFNEEVLVSAGSYFGGFYLMDDVSYLTLTTEDESIKHKIKLNPINEKLSLSNSDFFILPFRSSIFSSEVIFSLKGNSFTLKVISEQKNLFTTIKNELEKDGYSSTDKLFAAANYCLEINEEIASGIKWAQKLYELNQSEENILLLAKLLAANENYKEAINLISSPQDKSNPKISVPGKRLSEKETLIKYWQSKIE